MARPREFDLDQVVDDSMNLFWDRGYLATTMSDVVEHTGVSRASLYNTFGGKHELFIAAVGRYQREVHLELVGMLNQQGSPKAAIRRTMRQVAKDALDAGERGCLLTNSAVELAAYDREVRDRVAESFGWLERAFERAVIRGQECGEISPRQPARKVGRFLVNAVRGLVVIGKTKPSRRAVQDIVDLTLAALD